VLIVLIKSLLGEYGFNIKDVARPKPVGFVVKQLKPFQGKEWCVISYVDGKRKLKWFASEEDAREYAAIQNRDREDYGSKIALSAEQRFTLIKAEEIASRHPGATVLDGMRHYDAHLKELSKTVPFSVLATEIREEYQRRIEAGEVRGLRHVETLNETLKKLELRFGNTPVCKISKQDLETWLKRLRGKDGEPLAVKTRNKHRGYAGQIFSFALDKNYLRENPVSRIKKFKELSNPDGSDEIKNHVLSAGETEKLFRAAQPDPKIIPFLALWFFAGVRRATLEKLDWSAVKLSEKRVIVPRYAGKNDKRYRVTLSDNLVEWIRPHVIESGSLLAPARATNRAGMLKGKPSETGTRERIVAAARKAGITLPDNAGRHTFISMHVAHHESIDKTALESDNSSEIIKRNYLDIVTREDAAKFWEIRP
jgi:integrase